MNNVSLDQMRRELLAAKMIDKHYQFTADELRAEYEAYLPLKYAESGEPMPAPTIASATTTHILNAAPTLEMAQARFDAAQAELDDAREDLELIFKQTRERLAAAEKALAKKVKA